LLSLATPLKIGSAVCPPVGSKATNQHTQD
jgi:hypothetical protein